MDDFENESIILSKKVKKKNIIFNSYLNDIIICPSPLLKET